MAYEVVYFETRGQAEPVRLLLALAGQPFTDTRSRLEASPRQLDSDGFGWGAKPWLVEIREGERSVVAGTWVILRHLARVHGLYGATEAEHVACDRVVETVIGLRTTGPVRFVPTTRDPAVRDRFREAIWPHLQRLHQHLSAGDWFVGAAPTWADVVAFDTLDVLIETFDRSVLADLPELLTFVDRMSAVPEIGRYLATR